MTTYAGWESESEHPFDLYKLGVARQEQPEGHGTRCHPTLPVAVNRAAKLFVYWDHAPRMPLQTTEYHASQRATLRPATYTRLHENR